jgi:hypothetical protein
MPTLKEFAERWLAQHVAGASRSRFSIIAAF